MMSCVEEVQHRLLDNIQITNSKQQRNPNDQIQNSKQMIRLYIPSIQGSGNLHKK